MKKKILIIATGGTIVSKNSDEGLTPAITAEGICSLISDLAESYEITTKDLFNLDSSNIQPEEWQIIAQSIYENYKSYDGIVITHGTDTMAYSAAAISYMLRNIPIPIVFTGSQLPILHKLTDALENLRCALAMAGSGCPGVYVAFDRKIMLGCRTVKTHTKNFYAFESINYDNIAEVNSNGLNINYNMIRKPESELIYKNNICTDVFLLKLIPGTDPKIFDLLLNYGYKGIVIEAFGLGGLHFLRRDLVKKVEELINNDIPIIACSQCLYEKSDFSVYQTGKKLLDKGVIPGGDMTSESAVTKLMWALGQTNDINEIRNIFATNYVGEITL